MNFYTPSKISRAYIELADAVASYTSGVVGVGYTAYQIPQISIDGLEDTFVLPFMVDKTNLPYIINGKLYETLLNGITSITNAAGSATIVFDAPIPLDNVVIVFYSVTSVED